MGSECHWALAALLQWLHHDPLDLWIKDPKQITSASLLQKLGYGNIMVDFHSQLLRWYGHLRPHSVSNLLQTRQSLAPEGERGVRRRGTNVWRFMSENVTCLTLTCKTETCRGLVFYEAWCCQSHQMGQRDMDSTLISKCICILHV